MQLLTSYLLPPGCCTFCRGNALPTIDTGLSDDQIESVDLPVERRGEVYLCLNCANEVVQLVGGLTAQQVADAQDAVRVAIAERDAAIEAATEALENRNEALAENERLTERLADVDRLMEPITEAITQHVATATQQVATALSNATTKEPASAHAQ